LYGCLTTRRQPTLFGSSNCHESPPLRVLVLKMVLKWSALLIPIATIATIVLITATLREALKRHAALEAAR